MNHKARIYVIPVLLLCAVLSIIISGCIISGCSKDKEADFVSNPTTTDSTTSSTPTVTLTWDAPTTYTDNTALFETVIKEYRVYYSTLPITQTATSSVYTVSRPDPTSALTPTSLTVNNNISLATGTYYFRVTAVDIDGAESDFSNEVSKNIQ